MKIPKNKITKCFLDMYRFRPNNTVSNYVCSNNKKKSIINKLVPSLKNKKVLKIRMILLLNLVLLDKNKNM